MHGKSWADEIKTQPVLVIVLIKASFPLKKINSWFE